MSDVSNGFEYPSEFDEILDSQPPQEAYWLFVAYFICVMFLIAWYLARAGIDRIDMAYSERERDYIWDLEESKIDSRPRFPVFTPFPTKSQLFRLLYYLLNECLPERKDSDILAGIIERMSKNLADVGIEPPQSPLFPIGFTQVEEYHIDLGEEAST